VIDRWRSRRGYEAFLAAHREEYDARGAAAAPLYRREEALGRFDAVGP
jgi:hypothetical protein